jgi:molecular chaperone GrpE
MDDVNDGRGEAKAEVDLLPADDAAPAGAEAVTDALAELRRERDEYYDLLLRKTAEFENFRKRIERERREMTEQAAAGLIEELLPLVDDLERALQADPTSGADAYRQGVEIIYKQLLELLRKRGVTPIEAVGADFDPHVHQAVDQAVSADHREGEVMAELRRGYMLGDRLLRPAMVRVAKS